MRKLVGDLRLSISARRNSRKAVATTLAYAVPRKFSGRTASRKGAPGRSSRARRAGGGGELARRRWAVLGGGGEARSCSSRRGGHRQSAQGRISGTTAGRTAHAAAGSHFCSPSVAGASVDHRHIEAANPCARTMQRRGSSSKWCSLGPQCRTRTPRLAEMLSLSNDGRYPALDLAPHQRRQRTPQRSPIDWCETPVLMALRGRPLGRSADQPSACSWTRSRRCDLFVTSVRNSSPPWAGRPYVTALTINRGSPYAGQR